MEVEDKVQEEDDWIVDERVGGGGSCSVCRDQECGTAVCREQLTKEGRTARSDNAFEDFQRTGHQLIMALRSDETL